MDGCHSRVPNHLSTSTARKPLDGERRRNQRIVLLDAAVDVAKTAIVRLLRQSNALLRPHACDRGGVVEAQSCAPRSLRTLTLVEARHPVGLVMSVEPCDPFGNSVVTVRNSRRPECQHAIGRGRTVDDEPFGALARLIERWHDR